MTCSSLSNGTARFLQNRHSGSDGTTSGGPGRKMLGPGRPSRSWIAAGTPAGSEVLSTSPGLVTPLLISEAYRGGVRHVPGRPDAKVRPRGRCASMASPRSPGPGHALGSGRPRIPAPDHPAGLARLPGLLRDLLAGPGQPAPGLLLRSVPGPGGPAPAAGGPSGRAGARARRARPRHLRPDVRGDRGEPEAPEVLFRPLQRQGVPPGRAGPAPGCDLANVGPTAISRAPGTRAGRTRAGTRWRAAKDSRRGQRPR